MKSSRSRLAAGVFALALSAAPAFAAEHRLTAAELGGLAEGDQFWCENYSAETDDCEQLSVLRRAPDGRLALNTVFQFKAAPDWPAMEAMMAFPVAIQGDRLCARIDTATLPMTFSQNGKALPSGIAEALRLVFADSLSELDGKTACQVLYRGDEADRLREEMWVDGERRHDMESVYILREGGRGFTLRPPKDEDEQKETTL